LIDDDCNGWVDDGVTDPLAYQPCGSDVGECRPGVYRCNRGKLECTGAKGPSEEICNNRDDDCNGKIDDMPEEICYTGPEGTNGIGICHSGIQHCVDGHLFCDYQQIPEPEQCGSGEDYNCDGKIDGLQTIDPTDIVLAIDLSGSMYDDLPRIHRALEQFLYIDVLHAPDRDNLRFAMIGVPGEASTNRCVLFSDFATPDEFMQTVFGSLIPNKSGAEPTFDCMLGIVHPDNPFGLSFRLGAKVKVVLMTDEICESIWCKAGCKHGCDQWADSVTNWPYSADLRYEPLIATYTKLYMDQTSFEFYILTIKSLEPYYRDLTPNVYPLLKGSTDNMREFFRDKLIEIICE
jgi:hypothetical protein